MRIFILLLSQIINYNTATATPIPPPFTAPTDSRQDWPSYMVKMLHEMNGQEVVAATYIASSPSGGGSYDANYYLAPSTSLTKANLKCGCSYDSDGTAASYFNTYVDGCLKRDEYIAHVDYYNSSSEAQSSYASLSQYLNSIENFNSLRNEYAACPSQYSSKGISCVGGNLSFDKFLVWSGNPKAPINLNSPESRNFEFFNDQGFQGTYTPVYRDFICADYKLATTVYTCTSESENCYKGYSQVNDDGDNYDAVKEHYFWVDRYVDSNNGAWSLNKSYLWNLKKPSDDMTMAPFSTDKTVIDCDDSDDNIFAKSALDICRSVNDHDGDGVPEDSDCDDDDINIGASSSCTTTVSGGDSGTGEQQTETDDNAAPDNTTDELNNTPTTSNNETSSSYSDQCGTSLMLSKKGVYLGDPVLFNLEASRICKLADTVFSGAVFTGFTTTIGGLAGYIGGAAVWGASAGKTLGAGGIIVGSLAGIITAFHCYDTLNHDRTPSSSSSPIITGIYEGAQKK